MTSRSFPRGSEWRKWDLHIHAPGTKLNDQFAAAGDVWEEYCQRLEDSDVRVFGIADYFSVDAYLKAVTEFRSRHSNSTKVLFPNVELRTTDVVNKQREEVNVHLLFNPFQADHEEKLNDFLAALKTSKTDANDRYVRASELEHEGEFEEATTTRRLILEALEDTYGKNADLLDVVLIVTAANNDGIRPTRGKKRKAVITDEVDKFSDAFFGNAGNVEYFLSTDRAEGDEPTIPKPVLSGCDAHSFKDLDERLGQVVSEQEGFAFEPTWIKADPTFEGLKQIVFEPENRVFIGKEPKVERRVREHKTRYIESLEITHTEGYNSEQFGVWFDNESIPLNKELVAIIGNKGSGKSAVTDIIGLLGNSHNQVLDNADGGRPEELFSFLNSKKFLKNGCASHFRGVLRWYGGESEERNLDETVTQHVPERVEYLPQKYLERICADIADDEFRATLNEVIFRYVKPKHKYNQTNLTDLIDYLTYQAEEDIVQAKHELHEANGAVVALERMLTEDYRKDLEEKLALKKQELEAHQAERPRERSKPDETDTAGANASKEIEELARTITGLDERIAHLEDELVQANQTVNDLGQLRQAIARQVAAVKSLEVKHKDVLDFADLQFGEIVEVCVDYTSLDEALEQRAERVQEMETLLRTPEQIDDTDWDESERETAVAESLVCQRGNHEAERQALIRRLERPEREYQEYLEALDLWTRQKNELLGDEDDPAMDTLRWLEAELNKHEVSYPEAVREARAERAAKSKEIFRKKAGLVEFYNEVKDEIDREIAKCRDDLGEYDIAIEAGLRFKHSFYENFLDFLNQNVTGSFRGVEEGRKFLKELWDAVSDWEEESEVFEVLDCIVEALHTDKRPSSSDAPCNVFKQMRSEKTVQDLYDFLFGFEYLEPKYDLMVDDKDLSELSPGERGGLLLIFYLMLDRQDLPLVIDQPEDNLDNKSVYEILVTFIKEARRRRQIILVTHNPNLAVVADAEQIIHVSLDKRDAKNDFDFFSGGIENPRINRAVVDILEGTLPAFDNRRLKYRTQGQ